MASVSPAFIGLLSSLIGATVPDLSYAEVTPPSSPGVSERLKQERPNNVIVIAHRSCWKATSENSLAGVRACLTMGADGVEFDVRHTKDGVAVIMHDETVDRTTDGHGKVADMTFAELQALRLRAGAGGPSAAVTAEHVPTLRTYLGATQGRLLLVFDVKDGSQKSSFAEAQHLGLAANAIFFYECQSHLLAESEADFASKVLQFPIMFSADAKPLGEEAKSCPSTPTGMMHVKWNRPDYPQQNEQVWRAQRRVWIATMFPADVGGLDDTKAKEDPASVWGQFIDMGANMIMTNEPAALLDFLSFRANTK